MPQIDALEAAVSNSLDHWEALQGGYNGLKEKLEEQALRHEGMLEVIRDDDCVGDDGDDGGGSDDDHGGKL